MRQIDLIEYGSSEFRLTPDERDTLLGLNGLGINLAPILGRNDHYRVSAESTVGAIETGDLSILIRPKIGIAQLLAIASYAPGQFRAEQEFNFPEIDSVHDALALALVRAARVAFGRGVLRGYRTEERDLLTVRGRIAFAEQLRRRYGTAIPIAARYDEYTDDVLANQLMLAAAHRLGNLRLRSRSARSGIAWIAGTLQSVSLVEISRANVPEMQFDQLTEHYRPAINLARMILRHLSFESGRGQVRASGFCIDMNTLFQEFVFQALCEELARFGLDIRSDRGMPIMTLDLDGHIRLRPDISCWKDGRCTFVGDVKYKNLAGDRVPNSDIYQVLAYATAAGLNRGLLIYAAGDIDPRSYWVHGSGKRIQVVALDLRKSIDQILLDVGGVARIVVGRRHAAA